MNAALLTPLLLSICAVEGGDEQQRVRNALRTLAKIGPEAASTRALVETFFASDDLFVAAAARKASERLRAAVAPRAELLRSDSETDVEAWIEILRVGGHRATELAAAGLGPDPEEFAFRIAVELERLGVEPGNEGARVRSIDALGANGRGPEYSVPALRTTLLDPDPFVARQAALALGFLGEADPGAIRLLVELFDDAACAADAVNALARIGAPALPALREVLETP